MHENSATVLHDLFLQLMREYRSVYARVIAGGDWKNSFRELISKAIPEQLISCAGITSPYTVVGSYGKGRWTSVPWIAVFDTRITSSAQQGVYIVYLLNKDTQELYLTLEAAATEEIGGVSVQNGAKVFTGIVGKNSSKMKAALAKKVSEIRPVIANTVFTEDDAINSGSTGYDYGAVCYKKYTPDELPAGEVLVSDLKEMLRLYAKYVSSVMEPDKWWPAESEYSPGISKDQWREILNDLLSGSHLTNSEKLRALAMFYAEKDGATCSVIGARYGIDTAAIRADCMALARVINQKTSCPLYEYDGVKSALPILFLRRGANKTEQGASVWKLRPELYDALAEFGIEKYLPSNDRTGIFDSWEIIDEITAIKTCDKSFFEHNGSGVPKDICWFFSANQLERGETKRITLQYEGSEYAGRIANESSDRRRMRIFWSTDLGKRFAEKRSQSNLKAIFKRIEENNYSIVLDGGGEEKLSIKETIEQIKAYIAANGFTYENGLIENFYLSLKSKPFVILAGTSGTGKTRLVKLFAEAIGASGANGRYQMVSVRPDWSDSTDLFGHVDLNGRFIPGAIIDFVKRAEIDAGNPYILCLDEMNLARVEYYLSDILSVIETRDFDAQGHIVTDPLVSEGYFGTDIGAIEKYGTVRLPENLYIVGTVNMDETTFPFSKKVLDRANTIEFSRVNLLLQEIPEEAILPMTLPNAFLKTKYLLLKQCMDESDAVAEFCTELQEINGILMKANAHVGYRVRDEIVFYLLNNRESELLSDNDAMDNEIMQKILPRIQGSSASLKEMLCDLFRRCASDYEGYGTNAEDLSKKMFAAADKPECKYRNSAKKIAFMVRRFEEDGFTSYWL